MKNVFAPHLGRHLVIGLRKRPDASRPKRMMTKYMAAALPPAPDFDRFTGVSCLTDVLANDSLGDCTSAGALHTVESLTAAAGSPVVFTADDAIKFYSLATGYVVGQPATDQGGDEVQVLNTWQAKGLDGNGAHAIAAWVDVDPSNAALVKACAYHFNLYFGVELPDSWLNPFPSSNDFTWDVGSPDESNGHCFVSVGADSAGIQIDTWGLRGTMTYAAIAELCAAGANGALYAVITQEAINKISGLAPDGIDWNCLLAEFNSVGTPDQP